MENQKWVRLVAAAIFSENIFNGVEDSPYIFLRGIAKSNGDPFVFPNEERLFYKHLPCEVIVSPGDLNHVRKDRKPFTGIAHWESNHGLLTFKIWLTIDEKMFGKIWAERRSDSCYISIRLDIKNPDELKTPYLIPHHDLEGVRFKTRLIDLSFSIGKPEDFSMASKMSLEEANLIAFKNISDEIPNHSQFREHISGSEIARMGEDRRELYATLYRNIDHFILSNSVDPGYWEREYSNANFMIEELGKHLTVEDSLSIDQRKRYGTRNDLFPELSTREFSRHISDRKREFWPISYMLGQEADSYSFQDAHYRIRKLDIHILRALIYLELVENFSNPIVSNGSAVWLPMKVFWKLVEIVIKIAVYVLPLVALFWANKPFIAIVYTIILATFSLRGILIGKDEISLSDQYEELKSCLESLHLDREYIIQAYNRFNRVLNSKNSILNKKVWHFTMERLFLRLLSNEKYYEETIDS